MTFPETELDPARLLTIDVEAEVDKLARSQLDGAWQLAVELVRRALMGGARHLAIATGSRRLELHDDGDPIDPRALEQLVRALDPTEASERRHAALVASEAAGLGLLVGLDGLGARRLVLESGDLRLGWARHETPTLNEVALREGTRITIHVSLDRAQAREALRRACRFARAEVVLDGEIAPTGFDDTLAEASLPSPLHGRLGIPRRGGDARLWLLVGGIVTARMSVPSLPSCEVALEIAEASAQRSPAAAREAAVPLVPLLGRPLLELALELGRQLARHDASDQRQIRRLLLQAARRGVGRSEVLRLPILRAVVGGRAAWRALSDLGAAGRPIPAIPPDQDPERYLLPPLVLVLDSEERALLAEILGLRFLTPPVRRRPPRPGDRALEALRRLRSAVTRTVHRSGAALPESRLSAEERALVAHLRRHLSALVDEVLLCSGRRAPSVVSHGGKRQLRVGRHHPSLVAGRLLSGRDPAWLFPTVAALLGEREWRADDARALWLSRTAGDEPPPGA